MPQINEYQPEVQAQGAVGGVSPNLEAVSLFGRGVEHVGAALNEASDVIHKRQAQEEVSQVYGQFAQARADWNVKLKQRLKDGTLDPDKFDQEYADYVNKAGDSIQTAEGKDFFNRQANRLGGTLMQNAMIGKAKIAGEQAYSEISTGINVHVANLMSHPEQIDDALGSTQEIIQAKQKDGTLTPEQAIQAQRQLLPQLAEAAVKGLAEQDQGVDEKGKPYENLAKQSLDAGHFAELLNEPQRAALYQYARAAESRKEVEKDRVETSANRLLQAQGQDYMNKNGNRVFDGSLSVKEVMAAPLTFQQKEYMIGKIRAQSMDESRTDPKRFVEVYKKYLNGEMTTRDQVTAEFMKGGLAPATADHFNSLIDNTPMGHAVKSMENQFDKMAQGLRFKGAGGAYTQAGDINYVNYNMEVAQARQTAQAQGIDARAFYSNTNPKDPLSPIAILNKYRLNMIDRATIGANEAIGQVTGQGGSGQIRYSNSPTGEIPPPAQAPANLPPPAPEEQAPPQAPEGTAASKQKGGEGAYALEQLGLAGPSVDAERAAQDKQRADNRAAMKGDIKAKSVNLPAGEVPPESNKPNPANSLRKPGESIEAYSKRMGLK